MQSPVSIATPRPAHVFASVNWQLEPAEPAGQECWQLLVHGRAGAGDSLLRGQTVVMRMVLERPTVLPGGAFLLVSPYTLVPVTVPSFHAYGHATQPLLGSWSQTLCSPRAVSAGSCVGLPYTRPRSSTSAT